MRFFPLIIILLGGSFFSLSGCQFLGANNGNGNLAFIQSGNDIANRDLLVAVAQAFYKNHADDYDMLVLWGAPEFAPGHSFYLPVKNDVSGIGYENTGTEFFDDSAEFGSHRLQGIVWMGPDWIDNTVTDSGDRSVLGILAQETGHRWAATVHFEDPSLNAASSALLSDDALHWSFYLGTGASPMGGNQWDLVGDSLYQALPADHVAYCPLDLYLMGLVPAAEVPPLQLLVNVRSAEVAATKLSAAIKTGHPMTVQADVVEVSLDQIISVEGERDPNIGFNARTIRQAWIYVSTGSLQSSLTDREKLQTLQDDWADFFSQATGGRSEMSTLLTY